MHRPFSSWHRTFSALGFKLAKKKKRQKVRHGRQSRMESLEGRLLLDGSGWSAGLFVVDTAIDEDDGDYSLGDRSLREALSLATGATNHLIEFDTSLAGATIELTAELQPAGNVEIIGLGRNKLKIDAGGDAANPRRAFLIDADIDVTIAGLTIESGYANRGAGIYSAQADLLLQDVVVRDNLATLEGGGIYQLGGALEVLQSTVEHNSAQYGGGVFSVLGANDDFFLVESSLLENVAQHASSDSAGGALYVAGQPTGGATTAGAVLILDRVLKLPD